jgi:hypothetical protein
MFITVITKLRSSETLRAVSTEKWSNLLEGTVHGNENRPALSVGFVIQIVWQLLYQINLYVSLSRCSRDVSHVVTVTVGILITIVVVIVIIILYNRYYLFYFNVPALVLCWGE